MKYQKKLILELFRLQYNVHRNLTSARLQTSVVKSAHNEPVFLSLFDI